jgi:membrane-bound serine protease (ClpP class)
MKKIVALLWILSSLWLVFSVFSAPVSFATASEEQSEEVKEGRSFASGFVAEVKMNMLILPGTASYLRKSIDEAHSQGAKILVVHLDTPGGLLQTSQEMVQLIFNAPLPVVVYVSPSGSSATSAGVFITQAGHIAAMAPGTSIGAAKPVMGDGGDIAGDMKTKAENITVAMVKSISEERGRNIEWVEMAVRESASLTEREALEKNVIDLVALDLRDLLEQIVGKEVKVAGQNVVLEDYSSLPRRTYEISFTDRTTNVLANPTIAALLWLAATTGLMLELYNPGAILPGMVGLICLILALAVTQIIPISQGGIMLLVLGMVLIGAEIFVGSGILAIGGIISIILGAIYLVDVTQAPGLAVSLEFVIPIALALAAFCYLLMQGFVSTSRKLPTTGYEGLIGKLGTSLERMEKEGRIFVNGEVWQAKMAAGTPIEKGEKVKVVGVENGYTLKIEKA